MKDMSFYQGLLDELKKYYDSHYMKQFYAVEEKVLRIKHGNPVVKVLIGKEEEVIDDKEEVSK